MGRFTWIVFVWMLMIIVGCGGGDDTSNDPGPGGDSGEREMPVGGDDTDDVVDPGDEDNFAEEEKEEDGEEASDPCENVDCSTPPDECHLAGTCEEGDCVYPNAPSDTACNDGDACTENTTCDEGTCGGGNAVDCSDGNVCTVDSCDSIAGCAHEAQTGEIEGVECCTQASDCDDGDECTSDSCNTDGHCAHEIIVGAVGDVVCCDLDTQCDDQNPCSDDFCGGNRQCVNESDGWVHNEPYGCFKATLGTASWEGADTACQQLDETAHMVKLYEYDPEFYTYDAAENKTVSPWIRDNVLTTRYPLWVNDTEGALCQAINGLGQVKHYTCTNNYFVLCEKIPDGYCGGDTCVDTNICTTDICRLGGNGPECTTEITLTEEMRGICCEQNSDCVDDCNNGTCDLATNKCNFGDDGPWHMKEPYGCFKAFGQTGTRSEAEAYCNALPDDTYLATLYDYDDTFQDWLFSTVVGGKYPAWLSDRSDGLCQGINGHNNINYYGCETRRWWFLCEKDPDGANTQGFCGGESCPEDDNPCTIEKCTETGCVSDDEGYKYYKPYGCFKVPGHIVGWDDARLICEEDRGHLADPYNPFFVDWVTDEVMGSRYPVWLNQKDEESDLCLEATGNGNFYHVECSTGLFPLCERDTEGDCLEINSCDDSNEFTQDFCNAIEDETGNETIECVNEYGNWVQYEADGPWYRYFQYDNDCAGAYEFCESMGAELAFVPGETGSITNLTTWMLDNMLVNGTVNDCPSWVSDGSGSCRTVNCRAELAVYNTNNTYSTMCMKQDHDPHCWPDCRGRSCGDDGCGGICGVCGADQKCSAEGSCYDSECTEDSECGAGNFCDEEAELCIEDSRFECYEDADCPYEEVNSEMHVPFNISTCTGEIVCVPQYGENDVLIGSFCHDLKKYPSIDGATDFDGDGLDNRFEIDSNDNWNLTVNYMDGTSSIFSLCSHPIFKDTDSDGLSDNEEFEALYKSDPRKDDTDNDDLFDYEEVKIFKTQPNHPDSDRDSLPDKHELDMGTDPTEEDTDRDGILDQYDDHPLISNLPRISLEIPENECQSQSCVNIKIIGSVGGGSEQTVSVAAENSYTQGSTLSRSNSDSISKTKSISNSLRIETTASVEVSTDGAGVSASTTVGSETTWSESTTTESTTTVGTEDSEAFTEALTEARENSQQANWQYTGIKITGFLKATNVGDLPFKFSNLNIVVREVDEVSGLNYLLCSTNYYEQKELREDNSEIISYECDMEGVSEIANPLFLLEERPSLSVKVQNYELSHVDTNTSYASTFTNVGNSTATVMIRYSNKLKSENPDVPYKDETYHVALKRRKNGNAYEKLKVRDILQTIEDEMEDQGEAGTKFVTGEMDSIERVIAIGDVTPTGPNGSGRDFWYTTISRPSSNNPIDIDGSPLDFILETGDIVTFIYIADQDRDGLINIYEDMIGTSDRNEDTDGDGLKDGVEISLRSDCGSENRHLCENMMISSPLHVDSDLDGCSDSVEADYASDPLNRLDPNASGQCQFTDEDCNDLPNYNSCKVHDDSESGCIATDENQPNGTPCDYNVFAGNSCNNSTCQDGVCTPRGVCEPGAIGTASCAQRTCSDLCTWGNWSFPETDTFEPNQKFVTAHALDGGTLQCDSDDDPYLDISGNLTNPHDSSVDPMTWPGDRDCFKVKVGDCGLNNRNPNLSVKVKGAEGVKYRIESQFVCYDNSGNWTQEDTVLYEKLRSAGPVLPNSNVDEGEDANVYKFGNTTGCPGGSDDGFYYICVSRIEGPFTCRNYNLRMCWSDNPNCNECDYDDML